MSERRGVWVGLKRCGCCVAVAVDAADHPKETEKNKRRFLKEGLSVVYGTWQDWQEKYLPSMQKDCEHEEVLR